MGQQVVYTWNVYSKSNEYLGQIDAYSKKDAENLANCKWGDIYQPLHVEKAN